MNEALHTFVQGIIPYVHWSHLVVLMVLSLVVLLCVRKKYSMYGAVMMGHAVFWGLFLLDTMVFIRCLGEVPPHSSGLVFNFHRLSSMDSQDRLELFANIAVYVPFGFFLAEFQATRKRFGGWRRMGLVALAGFALSLCIECLQLVSLVGWFELTDLVMNTVGAAIGAGVSVLWRG